MNKKVGNKHRPRKKDDPDQSKRFVEMAEKLEYDQRVRPFEQISSKLLKPNKAGNKLE